MLHHNLKAHRKRHNLTQGELADKLETKRSNIGAYEEGRAEPKLKVILHMARLFHTTVEELYHGTPNLNP